MDSQSISKSSLECKVLFNSATPFLYAHNAFRISGVEVDATNREIKRRLEDLKASSEMGFHDDHKHAFAVKPHPTLEQIRHASLRFNDPEQRLVDEFFWFWPLDWGKSKTDDGLRALAVGDKTAALNLWKELKYSKDSKAKVIGQHNLAVAIHLLAIEWEMEDLHSQRHEKKPASPPDKLGSDLQKFRANQIDAQWKEALDLWEEMFSNETVWSLMVERVRAVDDPRLTTGFVRRLRNYLPEALDQINAMIALELIKHNRIDRGRDHIKYMSLSHQGADNVEKTIATITRPLHERVDAAVRVALHGLHNMPKEGISRATALRHSCDEPIRMLRALLGPESSEAIETVDEVAGAFINCVVAYAKATEDWSETEEMLRAGLRMSPSEKVKKRFKDNIEAVGNNRTHFETNKRCWFCKKNISEDSSSIMIKMHGDVTSQYTFGGRQYQWRKLDVIVPRCPSCQTAHKKYESDGGKRTAAIIGGVVGGLVLGAMLANPVTPIVFAVVGLIIALKNTKPATLPADIGFYSTLYQFPLIIELQKQKWAFGEKPSQVS